MSKKMPLLTLARPGSNGIVGIIFVVVAIFSKNSWPQRFVGPQGKPIVT